MNKLDRSLESLGWTDFFQMSFEDKATASSESTLEPARVTGQGKGHYEIQTGAQEVLEAAITSKFHDAVTDSAGFPTVGDWVTFKRGDGNRQATIHHVLKRKSLIQRRRTGGEQRMQLIAANVDYMLIVASLAEEFDLQKLYRYVALSKESGSAAVVLLTKADLCMNPSEIVTRVQAEFKGLEVFAISSLNVQGLAGLEKFFAPGITSVLVGSSGAGKSTLTNHLLGFESQKTQTLGADARGRHTTTARNLRFTQTGGLVIDTPGMQDVAALEKDGDLEKDFSEIEETMLRCKFTNCQHKGEPGCAILSAVQGGRLSSERWEAYLAAKANKGRGLKKRSR